jgi:hypothetical protein
MTRIASTAQKQRAIKYLNKDFESFKRDIVENHLKVYFGQTYQDFNDSNIGMMLVEIAAFVGDNLSFYLDKKYNESFIETATEARNIFKHAKQLGYKAFGKTSAFGTVDCFIAVPAVKVEQQVLPDIRYAGVIKKGAKLKSQTGQTFETLEDADFSKVDISNTNLITVASRDPVSKEPLSFALRLKDVAVSAGETKTTTFTVQSYQPFLTLTIPDNDVIEILSIVDSQDNMWYEVDFLAQDTVFDSVANTGADSTEVPYIMKLRSVPYRFISEYDIGTKKTSITFGTGDASAFDHDLVPNLADLSIPTFGKDTFTDYALDPQNFLKTRTLGLAPINTTLTIRYRTGGGATTNVGAGQIRTAADTVFDIGDTTLSPTVINDVKNSFSVLNVLPIQGGRDEYTPAEIKQLISANYAAQSRVVTAEDFIARTLSMPAKFGSVFRAFPKPGVLNKNSIELMILSKDSDGKVSLAPQTLKENLRTYLSRFRMLTDAVEILDGKIINIGINFSILVRPEFNKTQVLADCLSRLQSLFVIDKWQIGQPINRTDIHYLIADTPGVLSLYAMNIINLAGIIDGRQYSEETYNVAKKTKNNLVYCDENAIFEVRFPSKDLAGTAK